MDRRTVLAVLLWLALLLPGLSRVPCCDEIVVVLGSGCSVPHQLLSSLEHFLGSVSSLVASGRVVCPFYRVGVGRGGHLFSLSHPVPVEHPPLALLVYRPLCLLLGTRLSLLVLRAVISALYVWVWLRLWGLVGATRLSYLAYLYGLGIATVFFNESLALVLATLAAYLYLSGRRRLALLAGFGSLFTKYLPGPGLVALDPLFALAWLAALLASLAYWGPVHLEALLETTHVVAYFVYGGVAYCTPFLVMTPVPLLGVLYWFLAPLVYLAALAAGLRALRRQPVFSLPWRLGAGALLYAALLGYLATRRTLIHYYFYYPALLASLADSLSRGGQQWRPSH